MTDDDPKAPPGKGDAPKPEPTLHGIGPREQTVIGVGAPPVESPKVDSPKKEREATILGVGDETKPAGLVLIPETSVSDLSTADAPLGINVPPPRVVEPEPPPAAPLEPEEPGAPRPEAPKPEASKPAPTKPDVPKPAPAKDASPKHAPKKTRAEAKSVSGIEPAGVPRPGGAWKLLLLLVLVGAGVVAYLERDRIARELSPPPVVTATPSVAPSVTAPTSAPPVEDAAAPFPAMTQDGATGDASTVALLATADAAGDAAADAATKDVGAKDAGARDAGQDAGKGAGAKDAGATKDAGSSKDTRAKGATSAKPPGPKPAAKPAPKPPPPPPETSD